MFLHGSAFAVDWDDFDALYLYNPFEYPVFPDLIDRQNHAQEYRVQVVRMQARLAKLRAGCRVVTLHGFGGVMPPSFELVYHERVPKFGLDLVLWIQRSRARRLWSRL